MKKILILFFVINYLSNAELIKLKVMIENRKNSLLIHKIIKFIDKKYTKKSIKIIGMIGNEFKRCKNKSRLIKTNLNSILSFPQKNRYKNFKIINENKLKDIRVYISDDILYIYIEKCKEMILPTIEIEAEEKRN